MTGPAIETHRDLRDLAQRRAGAEYWHTLPPNWTSAEKRAFEATSVEGKVAYGDALFDRPVVVLCEGEDVPEGVYPQRCAWMPWAPRSGGW